MEQTKMDFSPDFPELSFTSRKKVVTEHRVTIFGKDMDAVDFYDWLSWLAGSRYTEDFPPSPSSRIYDDDRDLFQKLGLVDQRDNWVWERLDKFLEYFGEIFEKLEENEDPDYYLDEE
jgi:hypothetical protein